MTWHLSGDEFVPAEREPSRTLPQSRSVADSCWSMNGPHTAPKKSAINSDDPFGNVHLHSAESCGRCLARCAGAEGDRGGRVPG
jgi:hypothetical protein